MIDALRVNLLYIVFLSSVKMAVPCVFNSCTLYLYHVNKFVQSKDLDDFKYFLLKTQEV